MDSWGEGKGAFRCEGEDSVEGITKKQMRALWASAHRAGLTEEELRALTASLWGRRSIRDLTVVEASRLIEKLQDTGNRDAIPFQTSGRLTLAQARWIDALGKKIGWDPPHVLGLAKRMYSVERMDDLTRKEASGVIEALKALWNRSRSRTAA